MSATHSWWAMYLAALPMAIPSWPRLDEPAAAGTPAKTATTAHQLPPPRSTSSAAKTAAPRKRVARKS
ncbi:MAG TPA: hypothetical protein VE029_02425 [Rhizobacter sp.]|nr:hypothetical protein [Rhizobacter sp.]